MKCQKCGKYDATTHITEIVNGIKREVYLCPQCAGKDAGLGFYSGLGNQFESFFSSLWSNSSSSTLPSAKQCPLCGNTLSAIQKRGRLGCSECYKTFYDFLLRPLKGIHGSTKHTGKVPKRAGKTISKHNEIDRLKDELNRLILDQNFEQAAVLRDKIKEIESQGEV